MNTIHQRKEPIAIIGIGCRFPGSASNPKRFWDLLCQGTDAIIEVPEDRWDLRRFYDPEVNISGKMIAKRGGFLKEKWDEFDAEFFHISPREAKYLDPQQRLLLEIAWEAMEDGGLVPHSIRGLNGGVFIGAFTTDWQTLQNSPYNRHHCEMYSGINGSKTILSARLSHFFDLCGPCLSVDTACSSSLVAVHLACQSLWQNECSFALAGGVNAMLVPETSIAMSKGRFLNPEGLCRSFDADAKGYVRGEGAGIVILKPLSAALKDDDPIYALIRATGINQDGYTQGGITQPNPLSQRKLMEKVLADSEVASSDINYVEAHGTGTLAGDPAEAQAIDQVLNHLQNRKNTCFVGSVKSNIGHLEAAAGIAGLIKTALCLKHKKIPPNLHFKNPNPNIPFEKYCLRVPTALEEFSRLNASHFAFVNAFGYGGTNANVLLESYEGVKEKPIDSLLSMASSYILPFSAKDSEGLKEIAATYENFLKENPESPLVDIAHTLSHKRSAFDYRMSIVAQSTEELRNKLHYFRNEEIPEGFVQGKIVASKTPLAFVFTGMGPQWWGMGRDLLENSDVFLKTIRDCDEMLGSMTTWSLLDELKKSESDSRMEDAQVSQIANYSIQAALTNVLKTWGIEPDFIIGHSIGEVAAAYAAGALTLEEGLKVSYHRSRLQSARKDLGTMLATGLSMNDAQLLLSMYQDKISIAAVNSKNSTTLSGCKKILEEIAGTLEKKDVYHRFLKVNIAYHSYQMEGLEDDVRMGLSCLTPKNPLVPFFSTVQGGECTIPLDHDYWWQNIRKPVLFEPAILKMIENGCRLFLEIGPHPVLKTYIKEALQHAHINGEVIATLNRKKIDTSSLQECICSLFVNGHALSWDKINTQRGNFTRLPTYPWRKKSHWIESEMSQQYRLSLRQHIMLSRKIETALPTWQVEINRYYFSWLSDHKIQGAVIFPAAAYVEAGLAIQSANQNKARSCLEGIVFHQLLSIQDQKEPILQISLDPDTQIFKVHSLGESHKTDWIFHASGKCTISNDGEHLGKIALSELQKGDCIDAQTVYQLFAAKGLEYGPNFQGIKRLWKRDREAFSEIHLHKYEEQYLLHPTLLDSAFQTLIGAFEQNITDEGVILPSQIDQIILDSIPNGHFYCHAKCTKQSSSYILGDLLISDELGNVCVKIKGLKCRIIAQNSTLTIEKLLYQPAWFEKPLQKLQSVEGAWLLKFDEKHVGEVLKQCLQDNGLSCSTFTSDQLHTRENAEKLVASISNNDHLNILLGYTSTIPLNELTSAEILAVRECINLIKAIEKIRTNVSTNLWIITKGTQAVNSIASPPQNLFGGSMWGLGRVVRQEAPNIHCALIDMESDENIERLVQELLYSRDVEIALHRQSRYAYKIEKTVTDETQDLARNITLQSPKQAFSLELKSPGIMESLYYKEIEMPRPKAQEVAIQVHASSLNFKDLMKILGMLNQNALEGTYFGNSFGMECVGTIVSVGNRVKKYKVGDQVCAFKPNAFQSYIILPERFICPIPPKCTLDESAIYVPYITVLRALKEIGKLKKSETILIHSATGAVGLAAIQYARYVGARIFATAGSDEKRAYLQELGVHECSDSRSLSFADDILKWTGGKGVDVVLNSLGGDSLVKSWSVLAPYGRFLEIGKKDISINSKLPMKDFDRNTLFASIDLDRIFVDQPHIIKRLLKEAFLLFDKGVFKPLPCKIFRAKDAVEAFQFMARSKQIGKIMLKFSDESVVGLPLAQKQIVNDHSSYLITGGLSGFGLMTAKWLVEKGAKHLILLGRSGASSEEAQSALQYLKAKGINVKVDSVNVSNFAELSDTFAKYRKTMPPIKGIVHSAMVLNDAFLVQQTDDTINQVLLPKIGGCVNLHRLTEYLQLDFFVLFSSISSIIGNPGQANYAAANSFLDTFCQYRSCLGLPTTTINWGALNMGVLTRNTKVAEHLANHGIVGIPVKIALKVLEKCLLENRRQLYAFDIDWKSLMDSLPVIKNAFAFADFKSENNESKSTFVEKLRAMETDQRLGLIILTVKDVVAQTLKMESKNIDITVRLSTLGVDSLMTMELLATMENDLGVKVPTMELMKGPTIEQLASVILRLAC